ncbi:uncharacterized protein [Halyomorpha halys]|uniref:uncharacterized protein isoform X5 n=1 Tax=Halyomorpha halys TaxID=286706 RepID=UPI0006D51BA1|nr:adenomatous polyposis coli protein-like isoform X5 [Halyomorpha halys]
MTLPVSSYEELLNRVRSITHETRQLQRQIDAPLLDHNENERQLNTAHSVNSEWSFKPRTESYSALDSSFTSSPPPKAPNKDVGMRWTKEQGASPEAKEQEETSSNTLGNDRGMKLINQNPMCHSTSTVNSKQGTCDGGLSYSYSYSSEQLGTKVEIVYNLLSMLGTHDRAEMTSTLLAMSSSPDSCRAMRQSGCLSLLVQLVHSSGESSVVRERAAQALRNMVLCHGDDRRGRREARVLRLLDQIIAYTDALHDDPQSHAEEGHPGPAIAALMKLSFDEEHRLAMCQLGALYVVARLVQVEARYNLDCCITVKRYAGMALTNLTFGDGNNKALLCSMKPFMTALVSQLSSSSEDLTQVTASVLRNLSWRADAASKQALREVGSVPALMKAAMSATREPTLKSVLSALWNLSAHCNLNKVDICGVDGALQYLVEMLNYQSASKTLAVVENAGGILRNISSHIAVREDYRKILRDENCLAILLRQLQSASLTVVSNACGTLWNLSARCGTDQRTLVALGAVPMLTSLAHSRHRLIAMGASAALKNLLPVRLAQNHHHQAASGGATLSVRKRRALEAELNSSLSETCDNIEPCPNWDSEREILPVSQVKDNCDQINHSMQQMTLDETTELPVNYSLKYCENETKVSESDHDTVNYSIKFKENETEEPKAFTPCFSEKVDPESDYAETDLDQLTDYSLRYNEEEQPDPSTPAADILNKCVDVEKEPVEVVNSVEVSPGKIIDSGKGGNLETPLMFSRCSSLGSVSSIEQQDDGHSSVVSEFSRMTSGIMSPSELPDSPTQTVPPSPRVKAPPILPPAIEKEKPRSGIFEDSVVAFKEESTPAQFSTATSLSDLTFDDEPHETNIERKDLELTAVSEEEDEHVLADCINIGMLNNSRGNLEAVNTSQGTRIPRGTGIPVKTTSTHASQPMDETPMQFCTEDTPASLSHATSHSELSVALSDASSDHILAECIQSGMPQPQVVNQTTEKKKTKSETVPAGVKVSIVKPRPVSIPATRMRQLVAEDEISVFATEGSPGNFSIRSSLSDLTINSKPERNGLETPPQIAAENPSPLSSLEPDADDGEVITVLSATSGDDVTLAEQEDQALLMQLISSGMPSGMDSILSLTCSIEGERKKTESLLENVKPPPDMDDALDLDNSMVSVASLRSEIADDPSTPPLQRRLTPKQRRDLGNFRYNTYVIKGEERNELPKEATESRTEVEPAEAKEKVKEKMTPKQRRQADRDRFRTRTINDAPPNLERLSSEESSPPETDIQEAPESTSEAEEPPRPVVVKPPEVKSIRGGVRSSAIPVVRSPVKSNTKRKPGAVAPIQRQGTFTKEEPSSSSIPVPVRKVTSPLKKIPIGASKSTGNCSSSSASGRGRAASLPNKSASSGVRASASNQSLKSASSDGRWASNSSLNSQPVSRVAALWKRVDEAKKKQPVKDTRVWVSAEPKSKQMV